MVFRGGYVKSQHYMKTIYYRTELIKNLYDTEEELEMEIYDETAKVPEPKIIWQENFNKEHGYLCECKECGTKIFKTWEEADAYANAYWQKNLNTIKALL
jgi:hypothetical protein